MYVFSKEMNITTYLKSRGISSFDEGYSQQVTKQVAELINLTSCHQINVMEIGFNAGHSAEVFLKNNPTLTLTSFDLGEHKYVLPAKEYIDITYPNRHTLILGDSTVTVPNYIKKNTEKVFDVIFIDGGHDYSVANTDVENCRKLANKDTIVIIDDTIYKSGWGASWTYGPTKTWCEHLNNGTIKEMNREEYERGRGMSWGRYVF
jgi:predicted O-methyltransferase YrrM